LKRIAFGVVGSIVFVLVHGCTLTDAADGDACSEDRDCKSGRCREGFCMGSDCTLSDASSCDSGWKCTHTSPDAVSSFFGASGSDTCKPLCGHCPGNMHCSSKDPKPDQVCSFGKPALEIEISVADEAKSLVVGRPVKMTAIAPGAGAMSECTWELGDGKSSIKKAGAEITNAYLEARDFPVRALCKDSGGRIGSGERSLKIACTPTGEECAGLSLCCVDKDFRCVREPGGGGGGGEKISCRAPTPHEITITGPTALPVSTEAEFGATASGGDGAVQSFIWTFSDRSIGSETGTTVKHKFSKAGIINVTAKMTTDIGSTSQKVHPVTVCQTSNGSCDKGEPCCAPLTCTGTTFRRCTP
jgi:hypothetical protein